MYALLGFLVLPAVISNQAPKIIKESLKRELIISQILFNPFSLELSIEGLELKNIDNSPFVKFEQLYINVALLKSVSDLKLTIDEVLLKQPYSLVKRDKQEDFNFSDLLSSEAKVTDKSPKEDEGIFPFNITKIAITEGKISWEDDFHSQPQSENITPLNLTIDLAKPVYQVAVLLQTKTSLLMLQMLKSAVLEKQPHLARIKKVRNNGYSLNFEY